MPPPADGPPPSDRPERRRLGLVRGLALSFATIGATVVLGLTAEAAAARAWTWVQLGVSGIVFFAALALAVAMPERRRVRRVALALALLALARVAWAVAPAEPRVNPGALVATRYVRGGGPPRLWFAGLPERETVRVGGWVGLSPEEWKEGAASVDALYRENEGRAILERAESVLLDSWLFDREHYWLALPGKRAGPLPLIVFIHGNGGSFQYYPYLLARAATERGFAIAFATHGFGFWGSRPAAERIGRIIDAVAREVPVDPARVSLVGLSAGGEGIYGAALLEPGRYRSLVAVSAIAPDLEHAESLRGTRILILHGTEDPRARIEGARLARDQLVRAGISVELVEEKRSHLALLTAREEWVPRILGWIAAQ